MEFRLKGQAGNEATLDTGSSFWGERCALEKQKVQVITITKIQKLHCCSSMQMYILLPLWRNIRAHNMSRGSSSHPSASPEQQEILIITIPKRLY